MSNNNEECARECKHTSHSWTRRSSDSCSLREQNAQSQGSYLEDGVVRERLEHVLDLHKWRHHALQKCKNNQQCTIKKGHDEAMGDRIDIENRLKRLNRLSSKCIDHKYKPQEQLPNSYLLSNEKSWNCRIPPKLDIYKYN